MSDVKIDFRFSTPICQSSLGGFSDHVAGICEYVSQLQQSSEGIQSSNYNGWHSNRWLHVKPEHPDLQWLIRRVSLAAVKSLQKVTGRDNIDIGLREFWVNVNESGAWNMPHHHGAARWSGVVYISGESTPAEDGEKRKVGDGETLFLNPVPQSTYFGQPMTTNYRAEPGTMLMFPGYLTHMVTPYSGHEKRITFAFNIDMIDKSKESAKSKANPIPKEHAHPKVTVIT